MESSLHDKLHDRKNYNMDIALAELGGFGRFQMLATVLLTIARNTGAFVFYNFAFMVAEQTYVCSIDPSS